jgi:hypothetical protein
MVLLGFLLWLFLGLCCAQEAVKQRTNTHINKEVSSILRCTFRSLMLWEKITDGRKVAKG